MTFTDKRSTPALTETSLPHRKFDFMPLWFFFGLLLVVWLPGKLNAHGLWEVWIERAYLEGMPVETLSTELHSRPFLSLPYLIGSMLTPDSSVGLNFLLFSLFLLKGISFYKLLLRLLRLHSTWIALVCTAIFLFYPADLTIITLRMLTVHAAILFYLLAASLFLVFLNKRGWPVLMMWLFSVLALGSYELIYPIFLLTPLLGLLAGHRFNRLYLQRTLLFYLPLALFLGLSLVVYLSANTYQENVITGGSTAPAALWENFKAALDGQFWHGWRHMLNFVDDAKFAIPAGLATGAAVALSFFYHRQESIATALIMIGLGVGWFVVGIAIFIPLSPALYIGTANRVYLLSSAGAALLVCGIVCLSGNLIFAQLRRLLTVFVLSTLLFLSILWITVQRDYYDQVIARERVFLQGVTAVVPDIREDAYLIIYVPEGFERLVWEDARFGHLHTSQVFNAAATFLYGHSGTSFRAEIVSANEDVQFTEAGMRLVRDNEVLLIPYEKLVLVDYSYTSGMLMLRQTIEQDSRNQYHPEQHILPQLPNRIASMLA